MKNESYLPKHVAIIMDGNGRWALQKGLPRIAGHRAGVESVRKVVKASIERGVQVLSLFAFSSENWGRPKQEVDFLMNLFLTLMKREVKKFQKNNVQVRVIGNRARFSLKLQDTIHEVEQQTLANTGLKLVIAVDYGGCWDATEATRIIAERVVRGEIAVNEINEDLLKQHLCGADLPPPDLFIRTSGELRVSNFYLLQLAYTELFFTPVYWPDFDESIFAEALQNFANRERRYGRATATDQMDVKSA